MYFSGVPVRADVRIFSGFWFGVRCKDSATGSSLAAVSFQFEAKGTLGICYRESEQTTDPSLECSNGRAFRPKNVSQGYVFLLSTV